MSNPSRSLSWVPARCKWAGPVVDRRNPRLERGVRRQADTRFVDPEPPERQLRQALRQWSHQRIGVEKQGLTGEIPAELGNLRSLELLGLGQNRLTGRVPVGFCDTATFAHELGHNMGLNHDRYVACETGPCLNFSYPYAYGYVNQRAFDAGAPESAGWSTIMAYEDQCEDAGLNCQPILRFSNPRQSWNGVPLGVPGDGSTRLASGPADAVRTLNHTRHSVANFRGGGSVDNRAPVAVGTLPDRTLQRGAGPLVVSVADAFRDPDGDALSYSVASSSPAVAAARVTGTQVTVTPMASGVTTVAVTATDLGGSGRSATQSFTVTVVAD